MINLTCPSCTAELEIDDGFRGGVCRCFDCGTLMTVPDAPDAGRAETLSRPDSPDAPIVAEPDDEFERTGEFVTSSGHRVRLSSRQLQQVPTARKKRMGVRITVVAFMMSIVLAIIGCIIFGMYMIFAPPTVVTPGQIYGELFDYDANKNPYLSPDATFFSIPIPSGADKPVVLMADSSSAMRDGYIDWVKHNIWLAIPLMEIESPEQPVQVVFWKDRAPIVYPARPTQLSDLPKQLLYTKLTEVNHGGGLAAMEAFQRVMRGVPPKFLFVASHQLPPDAQLQQIVGMTAEADTHLVWVHLGYHEENAYLKQADADNKMLDYVPIPDGQLKKWYIEEYLGQRNGRLLSELDPSLKGTGNDED